MQNLNSINTLLKARKVGVSVICRGNRLSLRATLPPKPGSIHTRPHQQEISLKVRDNSEGLKYAEQKAKEVGALLACHRFTWDEYIEARASRRAHHSHTGDPAKPFNVAQWLN